MIASVLADATSAIPAPSLEYGALAPMLNSVAEFYEEEVSLRLGTLVSLIEPILLIFMGVFVAFILISLYLPIFSFSISGAGK